MMSLTTQAINEFASKPFIQSSLSNPFLFTSVLSFFFGVDYNDPLQIDAGMRKGGCMKEMTPFWYGGHKDYDHLCKKHFADIVRSVGGGSSNSNEEEEWNTTVDGKIAQLILCDQLSRNCFRGTEEAFAYDHRAHEISCDLCNRIGIEVDDDDEEEKASSSSSSSSLTTNDDGSIVVPSLNNGELYPPYITFLVTNLMHSENLIEHKKAKKLLQVASEKTSSSLQGIWAYQNNFLKDHTDVILKFGRYPHRNKNLNRISTEEELEWLSNTDELPSWAKSQ